MKSSAVVDDLVKAATDLLTAQPSIHLDLDDGDVIAAAMAFSEARRVRETMELLLAAAVSREESAGRVLVEMNNQAKGTS